MSPAETGLPYPPSGYGMREKPTSRITLHDRLASVFKGIALVNEAFVGLEIRLQPVLEPEQKSCPTPVCDASPIPISFMHQLEMVDEALGTLGARIHQLESRVLM